MNRDDEALELRDDPPSLLTAAQRPAPGEHRLALNRTTHRLAAVYLWSTAALMAVLALLLWTSSVAAPAAARGWAVAACAGAALLAAAAALALPRAAVATLVLGPVASLAAIGVAAVGMGTVAPAPGFAALHAALAMSLGGLGAGVPVAIAGLALVTVLAVGEWQGWFAAAAALPSLPLTVAMQALLVVGAAAGGYLAARLTRRFTCTADDREQRFRSLLRISADAYWELDAGMRLTSLSLERSGEAAGSGSEALGAVPWELPRFLCDAEVLDQLQADLGARQPLRDVPVAWQGSQGRRHLLVSGEPRFGPGGVFLGYWGVLRDVTAVFSAQHALSRTEARYHDLFVCIPNPLVLHRDGRVLDANPAALALFGFDELAPMLGSSIFDAYEDGESRELARQRAQAAQIQPAGEALPVAEFRMHGPGGQLLHVRATGVAVETDRGPAVLSIYVDDTERQAAEDVLRRSEVLLSHLVASSPDVITLIELASGRHVMVNRSFERITGWTAEDVIGRSSAELELWQRAEDRQHFFAQMRSHGRVRDLPMQFRRRDGAAVPMLVSGARFHADRCDFLVINARDMTELERQRLQTEAILENASLGIALTREQAILIVNPAFEAMFGWPEGSIVGQPGAVVWPSEEAYREVGRSIGPRLASGEQIEFEGEMQRRDGSRFLCRMLARAVDPSHPSRGGTIWVAEDITERRRLDEALARARDAAEAANRAKSAFLANTSHELRTPLNGLLGLARLARSPELDPACRNAYLDQIVDSARALAEIVTDILDLSKIEAGRLTIESAAFDLGALLASLQRSYATLAAGRGLSLTTEVDAALGTVCGDALRVRQILTNYLGNALKFTARGEVRLLARRVDTQRVRLEVADTGPGIDEATQARLFQSFMQADQSTTRRYGGTGLGLSICRELARLMGGEAGVESRPGEGSRFWVELPLPVAAAEPPRASDGELVAAMPGAHVLLVDDNAVNMLVAAAQLTQAGVRTGQAADGRQALAAVAAAAAAGDPYALVLMDLQMPGLSGYEVTAELRRRFSAQELPIVAHTAAALVSEREAALAAGMNDFLPKPADFEQLRAMVARWVRPPGAEGPAAGQPPLNRG